MEPSGEMISALKIACFEAFPVILLLALPAATGWSSLLSLALMAVADELPGLPSSMRAAIKLDLQSWALGLAKALWEAYAAVRL